MCFAKIFCAGIKLALRDISKDEHIIKYGFSIGHATENIMAGSFVHTHNIRTNLSGVLDYEYKPENAHPMSQSVQKTFRGFVRSDGSVGVRNEIWIIPTVGCVNKIAERIAHDASEVYHTENLDGIFTFTHPYGCSQLGDDLSMTQKILARLALHPNAAGVLVVGLGCENNNIKEFKKFLPDADADRIRFIEVQNSADEIEEGVRLVGGTCSVCFTNLCVKLSAFQNSRWA